MFFVLKKKYDSLNFSHQHLRFEYERNLREIENLKGELLEIKQKEEDEKKFFSENLEKYNRFKNKVKEIEKMTINARCQYFINNYDLKVVEDNKSYKEFIDNDDATRWGKLNFSNYSSPIKKLRYQIYLYNPFLFNDIKTLNSITSGIEYYCGYPY